VFGRRVYAQAVPFPLSGHKTQTSLPRHPRRGIGSRCFFLTYPLPRSVTPPGSGALSKPPAVPHALGRPNIPPSVFPFFFKCRGRFWQLSKIYPAQTFCYAEVGPSNPLGARLHRFFSPFCSRVVTRLCSGRFRPYFLRTHSFVPSPLQFGTRPCLFGSIFQGKIVRRAFIYPSRFSASSNLPPRGLPPVVMPFPCHPADG